MKEARVNNELEAAVNKAVAAILMIGIHEGMKVMMDNQVPLHVANRIVLGSKSRRSSDWKSQFDMQSSSSN